MKTITISAEEDLVRRARKTARFLGKTLEEAMLEWLEAYAWQSVSVGEYDAMMKRLRQTVRSAGPYTRDEMNER